MGSSVDKRRSAHKNTSRKRSKRISAAKQAACTLAAASKKAKSAVKKAIAASEKATAASKKAAAASKKAVRATKKSSAAAEKAVTEFKKATEAENAAAAAAAPAPQEELVTLRYATHLGKAFETGNDPAAHKPVFKLSGMGGFTLLDPGQDLPEDALELTLKVSTKFATLLWPEKLDVVGSEIAAKLRRRQQELNESAQQELNESAQQEETLEDANASDDDDMDEDSESELSDCPYVADVGFSDADVDSADVDSDVDPDA
ncbi:hypothetical protein FN846DRAFT_928952 [Sphaerosporella brunnea]|uniref:Uncharacterized protein n=1 Tax=Sphaerosporella brunnea TaxID=1250544 RepID=A0A5J5F951_9PEZI|nr:hypothetical protein FN846DRAFT_928952 [Sphaerosporella brunnea]